MQLEKYPDTIFNFLEQKSWFMTKEEAYEIECTYLKDKFNTLSVNRLRTIFQTDLDYSLKTLLFLESKLRKIQPISNKNISYPLSSDLYAYLGGCLITQGASHNVKLMWMYWSYGDINSTVYRYKYNLTGFMGKYKGRDPDLFMLITKLNRSLKLGTYTDLLSKKFIELAPYTRRKAPKS